MRGRHARAVARGGRGAAGPAGVQVALARGRRARHRPRAPASGEELYLQGDGPDAAMFVAAAANVADSQKLSVQLPPVEQ